MSRFWPSAGLRRRWRRAFDRAPRSAQIVICLGFAATISLTVNWIYQVVRKPSELFFPVSGTLFKTPAETWREYQPAFEKYSTSIMTPQLLAALAQVEGSGNPIARTYWRWSWTIHPFAMYRPASSAVGMYQITDGTFAEAKRYCIRDHVVVEDGPGKTGLVLVQQHVCAGHSQPRNRAHVCLLWTGQSCAHWSDTTSQPQHPGRKESSRPSFTCAERAPAMFSPRTVSGSTPARDVAITKYACTLHA